MYSRSFVRVVGGATSSASKFIEVSVGAHPSGWRPVVYVWPGEAEYLAFSISYETSISCETSSSLGKESFRNLAPAKKVQRVPFECTLGPARQGSTTTLRLCDLVSRRRVWAEGSCNAPGALSSKCRPCPKSVKARREEGVRAVSRTSGSGAAVLGDFIEQRDCFLRRTTEILVVLSVMSVAAFL